jgi:hypothetical protein
VGSEIRGMRHAPDWFVLDVAGDIGGSGSGGGQSWGSNDGGDGGESQFVASLFTGQKKRAAAAARC